MKSTRSGHCGSALTISTALEYLGAKWIRRAVKANMCVAELNEREGGGFFPIGAAEGGKQASRFTRAEGCRVGRIQDANAH